MVPIGKLNKRIELHKHSVVDNGRSDEDRWTFEKIIWACVEWVSDGEKYRAGALGIAATVRIIVRNTDITSKDRIIYGGQTFSLTSVKPVQGNSAFLELSGGLVNG